MIERDEMLAPQMVERLQDNLLLDVSHDVGRVALNPLRIGILGRLMEPGRDLFVGNALLLGPSVDREVEAQLIRNLTL